LAGWGDGSERRSGGAVSPVLQIDYLVVKVVASAPLSTAQRRVSSLLRLRGLSLLTLRASTFREWTAPGSPDIEHGRNPMEHMNLRLGPITLPEY
jgi:hypothetical protein